MTALLRAATLTNFESVAVACGLDPHRLVAAVGLPARCLSDPDLLVPAAAVSAVLELAAERGGEPAFGLRMAAARRLSNLGTLGLLLRDQPTLREALEALVTRFHLHNEAMTISLVQDGPLVAVREDMLQDVSLRQPASVRQSIELAMGTTFRVMAIFLGDGWRPRQVNFRHRPPASAAWHHRVFGDHVQFGQPFNEVVCRASDLEARNPGADPVMARYSQRLLEADKGLDTMRERVRRVIVLLLPRGHCRVEAVAQHLGVDRRTVANRLAAEGTTYSAVVDEMRCELLQRYLDDRQLPLAEVAVLLGFSEHSAFSRWHRGRFGFTARTARAPDGRAN